MRCLRVFIICATVISGIISALPAYAATLDFMSGLAVGVGINQATENQADESFALSFKSRETRWEYGLDLCMAEDFGGVGDNNFGFIWGAWLEEFQRPEWQDYGIYVGAGAGVLLLQDDLVDWPAGPFAVVGWDFSSQAGLEGKVGYFGENYWGTAMLYWYFK
jgi:hypothetical protein